MSTFDTTMKLRVLTYLAEYKIAKNRHKDVPGKWPEDAKDPETGERSWLRASRTFLDTKLQEEIDELYKALDGESSEEILLEAADVIALVMMIVDHATVFDHLDVGPRPLASVIAKYPIPV